MFPNFAVIQSHGYDVHHLCSSLGCSNDVDEFLLTYGSGGLGAADWNSSELLNDWTSKLDWLNPPSRSPAQMSTTIHDDQRFPGCIQASKLSQDVRPGSRCRNSLTDEQHHRFYYFYSINIPYIYNITFCYEFKTSNELYINMG